MRLCRRPNYGNKSAIYALAGSDTIGKVSDVGQAMKQVDVKNVRTSRKRLHFVCKTDVKDLFPELDTPLPTLKDAIRRMIQGDRPPHKDVDGNSAEEDASGADDASDAADDVDGNGAEDGVSNAKEDASDSKEYASEAKEDSSEAEE